MHCFLAKVCMHLYSAYELTFRELSPFILFKAFLFSLLLYSFSSHKAVLHQFMIFGSATILASSRRSSLQQWSLSHFHCNFSHVLSVLISSMLLVICYSFHMLHQLSVIVVSHTLHFFGFALYFFRFEANSHSQQPEVAGTDFGQPCQAVACLWIGQTSSWKLTLASHKVWSHNKTRTSKRGYCRGLTRFALHIFNRQTVRQIMSQRACWRCVFTYMCKELFAREQDKYHAASNCCNCNGGTDLAVLEVRIH